MSQPVLRKHYHTGLNQIIYGFFLDMSELLQLWQSFLTLKGVFNLENHSVSLSVSQSHLALSPITEYPVEQFYIWRQFYINETFHSHMLVILQSSHSHFTVISDSSHSQRMNSNQYKIKYTFCLLNQSSNNVLSVIFK